MREEGCVGVVAGSVTCPDERRQTADSIPDQNDFSEWILAMDWDRPKGEEKRREEREDGRRRERDSRVLGRVEERMKSGWMDWRDGDDVG
jgi:hypothetical protein